MKKSKKKIILLVVALLVLAGGAFVGLSVLSGFDIDKSVYVYVDKDTSYDDLLTQLDTTAHIESRMGFDLMASLSGYKSDMRAGRYAVTPDMTTLDLFKVLRNGRQTAVRFTFNNIRTKDDFAQRACEQLMFGKDSLLDLLDNDAVCLQYGFDSNTVVAMFIPNTYDLYWDITPEAFLERMSKEYARFWNEERSSKAKEIGLSPIEVSTLASIVEEECRYVDEYPVVAGLYMNRLRIGQKLQADPTVKFAVGDPSLRRILNIHLAFVSPYNTYLKTGLPPGPIRIPSIKGIDAVLHYDKNDYLYMCAKEDLSGYHNFTSNYAVHLQNRDKYTKSLDERGIR